jgi:hypothetical protein
MGHRATDVHIIPPTNKWPDRKGEPVLRDVSQMCSSWQPETMGKLAPSSWIPVQHNSSLFLRMFSFQSSVWTRTTYGTIFPDGSSNKYGIAKLAQRKRGTFSVLEATFTPSTDQNENWCWQGQIAERVSCRGSVFLKLQPYISPP